MMLDHWVQSGYASASEYIRELIRNDLRQNGKLRDPHDLTRVRFKDGRSRRPDR